MKKQKITEEQIAAVADLYFTGKGWELYPEVVLPYFGGRPDFVGTKESLVMVAECKVSFSYPVLEQLTRWRHSHEEAKASKWGDETNYSIPHLLYAVVGNAGSISDLKLEILQSHRIGLLAISLERGWNGYNDKENKPFDSYGYGTINGERWRAQEIISPKIQHGSRRTAHKIAEQLNSDMRCATAGASGKVGGYMTPFRRTMNKAKEILSDGKEWHIQHIIDRMNSEMGGHHYASDSGAKSSISKFLISFEIAEQVQGYSTIFKIKESAEI